MVRQRKCISCRRDMYIPNSNNVIYSIMSKKYSKIKCPKCVDKDMTFIDYTDMLEQLNKEIIDEKDTSI